ncbi:MAG: hypothetical protein KatS3mg097_609 [Candidatus Parcubacteria bacterium]|nr:MAG: hypothetical protein KatS3mg097_609 [Candidatus Parcubacteria bacterium]
MLDAIIDRNQPTVLDVSDNEKYLTFSNFLDNNLEIFEMSSYEELKRYRGRSNICKSQ